MAVTSPPRQHRPDDRGVRSTTNQQPPPYLVVDTSAFAAALLGDEPRHLDYAGFLTRCAENQTVLAYSELVELELAEAAIRIEMRRLHGKKANAHRYDEPSLIHARVFASQLREAFEELLSGFDVIRVHISQSVHALADDGYPTSMPLVQAAVRLVERTGVGSYDAAHAVCAAIAAAPLLARDIGFARVPGLTLITDPSRVAAAREFRASPTQN